MNVRAYRDRDWSEWLRMSCALFPEHSEDELEDGMREHRARTDAEVFVAEDGKGTLCGFIEVGARRFADGCATSPVGYIEAWYVDPSMRRHGVGRALLSAAERWARNQGYREMASDALLDNDVSHRAHRHAGYQEVERSVKFRKPLDATEPMGELDELAP